MCIRDRAITSWGRSFPRRYSYDGLLAPGLARAARKSAWHGSPAGQSHRSGRPAISGRASRRAC
eukprot:9553517-Heterocapsa_arctica.AAC.2